MGWKQDQAYERARQADITEKRGDPRFNTYLKKRRREVESEREKDEKEKGA